MKIAIAQINPKLGDVHRNRKNVLENIAKAKTLGARLVVFPELALTGYPPRDLLDYSILIEENLKALNEIKHSSRGIGVVCGYVEKNPEPFGKPFYNAAAIFDGGERIGNYRKQLLPYYDVFEDERYFESGKEGVIFSLEGKKIGITICEDVWNAPGFLHRPYLKDPIQFYAGKQLDLLINLSASPFHAGKHELRLELFKETANRVQAPVVFCNQVGANDELIFDGSSFIMGKNAGVVGGCPAFQEALSVFDIENQVPPPVQWPQTWTEALAQALTLGIRDYVHKTGFQKVCLGLSGGIDSSVVAVLAKHAVGKENVEGVCLPTRFSSQEGLRDAIQLGKNLGISHSVVPIENYFNAFETGLAQQFGRKVSSLTLENVQPRLRMTLLMAVSNETKSLLLNTSNKSEVATGFSTLYGDSSGALGVLGDLTKHEVYELACYFNRQSEVIPESILRRLPTAELKENQTDQDVLPPYRELDILVTETIEELVDPRQADEEEVSSQSVATYLRLHALSEYKRKQFPPILRVSARAFGMGRRIPIASLKPLEL